MLSIVDYSKELLLFAPVWGFGRLLIMDYLLCFKKGIYLLPAHMCIILYAL